MINIDKRILNLFIIVFLTFLTFTWTFWIFHQSYNVYAVFIVGFFRIIASIFIFKDYSLSWSKATQKTFLIKTFVYIVPLFIYIPIFYTKIRIALFLSEFAFFLLAMNFIMYSYFWIINRSKVKPTKTLVIYGAGSGGVKLSNEYKNTKYKIICFIDDDVSLQKRSIDGTKIISSEKFIKNYTNNKHDLLVVAMPSVVKSRIAQIHEQMNPYFTTVKILPSLEEILQDKLFTNQLKSISIEDLLARHPQDLDTKTIAHFLAGKRVLVTGAGGSIGSEICRQCLKNKAEKIFALDHSEYNLYTLSEELKDKIKPIMHSVLNYEALKHTISTSKPDIIIHAAAYKHVHLVEENIQEAIENNILGTKYCIDLADEYNIQKFIFISTDKAVRPTNIMGATKRVCELYGANKKTKNMEIISVRFGNVLGSSGSVIPKFKSQIASGGPITITHPEITRYFMLISEACQLVLQSGAIGKGGEVFVLNMGKPVKILDLAKKMIALSDKKNIDIEFIGLRAGEKLYEELIVHPDDITTQYPSIIISKNKKYDIQELNDDIQELLTCKDKVAKLQHIVPEFNHMLNI